MITGLNLKALIANHSFFLFTEYFISTTIIYILIVIVLILYSAYGLLLQKSLSECIFIILIMCCYLILNDDLFALNNIYLNNFIAGDSLGNYAKLLVCFFAALYFLMVSTTLKEQKLTSFEYLLIILFAVLGLVLLCSSNDFLTVYLSIELFSLSLYILASFKKDSNYSIKSGLKYFITGAISSAFFLLGCSFIYLFYGSINFNDFFFFFESVKKITNIKFMSNYSNFFLDNCQIELLKHLIITDNTVEMMAWFTNYLDVLSLNKINCNYTEFFFLYHLLITKQHAFIWMWVNMHANTYNYIENVLNNTQFEFFEYLIYDDRKKSLLLNLWIHVLHENENICVLDNTFSTHFSTANIFFMKHLLRSNNIVAYTLWKTGFLQTIIPSELIQNIIRIALENNLKEIVQKDLVQNNIVFAESLSSKDDSPLCKRIAETYRNLEIKSYLAALEQTSNIENKKILQKNEGTQDHPDPVAAYFLFKLPPEYYSLEQMITYLKTESNKTYTPTIIEKQNFIRGNVIGKDISEQSFLKKKYQIEDIPFINCKRSLNILELLYNPHFEGVPLVCSEPQLNFFKCALVSNDWTAIVLMLESIFFCNLKPSEIILENNMFNILLSFYSQKDLDSLGICLEWWVNTHRTDIAGSLDVNEQKIFAEILSNQKRLVEKKAFILQKYFHVKEENINYLKNSLWRWVYVEVLQAELKWIRVKIACPQCFPEEINQTAPYMLLEFHGYNYIYKDPEADELINLNLIEIGLALMLISFFIKLACAPFHVWSLDVYQGSPTNSSFFFAVITKLSIFVVLIRLFYFNIFNFSYNLQYYFFCTGILSVFVGSFGGLKEKKLKTLMAYSSITNMGYGLLSLGTGTSIGIQALFVHLIIYMLSGLCIWSIIIFLRLKNKTSTSKTNNKHIKELSHLALLKKSNNALAFGLSITIFSIAGIPPLIGFLAKIGIFLSMLQQYYLYFLILSAILSVVATFYYIRIIKLLYFENLFIGKLYYPLNTSRTLILSILIISLLILFLNPSILYLFSYILVPPLLKR